MKNTKDKFRTWQGMKKESERFRTRQDNNEAVNRFTVEKKERRQAPPSRRQKQKFVTLPG
jgi:hypothetical protein